MNEETVTVRVRDRVAEDASWGSGLFTPIVRTVEISAFCQVEGCGARRGQIRGLNTCEDGVYFHVNTWENECGHVDGYAAVLREAAARRARVVND